MLSDLYYNRHRDYDPVTGRYVQADPIGLDGGSNLYLYAGGNPVSQIDPDGLLWWWVAPALIGGLMSLDAQLLEGRQIWCIDPWDIALGAAAGALTGGMGGSIARSMFGRTSIKRKGDLGELMARAGILARRERLISRKRPAGEFPELGNLTGRARRAQPDFIVRKPDGKYGVVEAKFNTGRLSPAQRALEDQIGGALRVSRTSEESVIGAARGVSAVTGSAAGLHTPEGP